jgi:hypothetical protein
MGQAALRREQQEQLDSNRPENRGVVNEGEASHRHHKHSPSEKKKWRYTCRLFGMNSLKEGAMWHVDPLLGIDFEMSKYATAVTK